MSREKEIEQAAKVFIGEGAEINRHIFAMGAGWADANPAARCGVKKPESFPWDDDPSNNHGWYDAEEMDAYLAASESELSKYKEALSEKLTEDRGYCQEYTGIVILKEKLVAAEAREVKLVEALEKIKSKSGMCIFGSSDTSPDPKEAFRQGSALAFSDLASEAAEALEENKELRGGEG